MKLKTWSFSFRCLVRPVSRHLNATSPWGKCRPQLWVCLCTRATITASPTRIGHSECGSRTTRHQSESASANGTWSGLIADTPIAPNIEALIALRALQGATGAPLVPLAMSMLLGDGGSDRKMSPSAGIALGPTLGGLLIPLGSSRWRTCFIGVIAIGLGERLARAAQTRLADRSGALAAG